MPPNTVKVDRTTRWGNPFRVGQPPDEPLARKWGWWPLPAQAWEPRDDAQAVMMFALMVGRELRPLITRELRGTNLACWCQPDERCHADLLLKIANRDMDNEVVPFRSRKH
jgi:hypothetical protein